MRIIGGQHRGRNLKSPKGKAARPLRGRLREALFSILAMDVPDARVLDLFSGTGAVGIEALSRGARFAAFVEQNPTHARLIKQNLETIEDEEYWRVINSDVLHTIPVLSAEGIEPFHIVYLGAPYNQGLTDKALALLGDNTELLGSGAICIAETHTDEVLPEQFGSLKLYRRKTYGITTFSFYALEIQDKENDNTD
jgi:16S rRNA (guanine(966)-N(2))-methyltransferase RsmD